MARDYPPQAVLVDFVRRLRETVHVRDPLLVLRGSLLLRHWFGDYARPAADLDLECFDRPRNGRQNEAHPRFTSHVDHARGLCSFAAQSYHGLMGGVGGVEYDEIDVPSDGQCLWEYGAPGERFYLGWIDHSGDGQRGRLQIDIAEAGPYEPDEIGVADVELGTTTAGPIRFPAYTPEMMLAAKLSWLLRSLERCRDGNTILPPVWKGQLKDLFDIHLLLTRGALRAEDFRRCLLTVGTADGLQWNNLEAVFDVRRATMSDNDFADAQAFRAEHPSLASCRPAEMLRVVADRLEPLLGDFYLREEMPFLLAINADPVDEFSYLVYADWLEDHGIDRAKFLRLYTVNYFHRDELSAEDRERNTTALRGALHEASPPWLLQLFGTSERFREVRQRIDGSVERRGILGWIMDRLSSNLFSR